MRGDWRGYFVGGVPVCSADIRSRVQQVLCHAPAAAARRVVKRSAAVYVARVDVDAGLAAHEAQLREALGRSDQELNDAEGVGVQACAATAQFLRNCKVACLQRYIYMYMMR